MSIDRLRTRAERLASRPWLPYLILAIAPLAGHLTSVLTGLSSNPFVNTSGMTIGNGSGLLAGLPYADLNIGWTNQALGHLAAQDWLHGEIPWWNPYTGIGLPLAGEMQPAALFMPFVLLLIFHDGVLWLIWVMQALAGIATFALLRSLGLRRWTALVGGLLFIYNGTFATAPGETILNVVPFLPILLLGIEAARRPGQRGAAIALVAVGIGWSLLGGFPEGAYIDGLLGLVWALARIPPAPARIAYGARIAAGGIVGLLIAAPGVVAFQDFIQQSDAFAYHRMGLQALDPHGLGAVLLPYIFGPLGTSLGSDLLVRISGGIGGYVSIMTLPFALIGLVSRRAPALQAALGLWFLLCMAKSFGFPPVMAVMNALPYMQSVEFFRYASASWELAIIVLAMFGLEAVGRAPVRWGWAVLASAAVAGFAAVLASPWAAIWHWQAAERAIMTGWFCLGLGLALAGLAAVAAIALCAPLRWQRYAFGAALIANAFLLFGIPQLSGVPAGHIDRAGLAFLHDHAGLGRIYTTGPIAPNYPAYFDIASINDNYLPIAKNWADFVAASLSPAAGAHHSGIFWGPFPPMTMAGAAHDVVRLAANYRRVGVRYVVTVPGASFDDKVALPKVLANPAAFALEAGDRLTLAAHAPSGIGALSPVQEVAVDNATYGGTADGTLTLTLCAGGRCASGSGGLRHATDDAPFWVELDHPLPLAAGEAFTMNVARDGGTHPNALWVSTSDTDSVLTATPPRDTAGKTFQVLFSRGLQPGALTRVYSDKAMDIWRLAGAKPYFTVAQGVCHLSDERRRAVTAVCAGTARLLRRELFMPGWHARIDGRAVPIDAVDHLMQSVALHAGRNRVRFRFAPPFSGEAWVAFWLGMVLLAVEITGRLGRRA